MKTNKRSKLILDKHNLTIFLIVFIFAPSLYNTKSVFDHKIASDKGITRLQNFDAPRRKIDKNQYYSYSLPNKLEVLIISNLFAFTSAAAITVNTGSMNEGDIYGLAHFTEHMLFLGSKKYQEPTKFVDFITLFNGRFNGFTSFDQTAYFFKIHNDKFDKALDIFSRFFIDPLFDSKYIVKEVNSVNSEYERNVQLDSKRKEQVFRELSDPTSSFHRFTTGNSQTLLKNNTPSSLRKAVIDFYNKYYTPDNMKLIIYGDEDVEYYKALVDETFGNIKPKKKAHQLNGNKILPFKYFSEGKLALYQSINRHQELDINILLPDLFDALPHNIGQYYKILINFKGKGSLVDVLRKKALGSKVHGFVRRTYRGWGLFRLRVNLSKQGIKNINKVLKIIYRYFIYLGKLSVNKKFYDHIRRYNNIRFFMFKKRKTVLKTIKALCISLQKYKKKYLFAQHFLIHEYDKEKNKDFSKYFAVNNSIILLGDKSFNSKITKNYSSFLRDWSFPEVLSKKDQWYLIYNSRYNTKYSVYKISDSLINDIVREKKNPISSGLNDVFHYLKIFNLPQRISLVKKCPPEDRRSCLREYRRDRVDLTPKILQKTSSGTLWHKRDRSFFVSKVNFLNKFIFSFNVNDAKYTTLQRLYVYAIHHVFRNFFYNQALKQTKFLLKANANGFSVKIFSFKTNINSASSLFFKNLISLKLNQKQFDFIRDEMRKIILSKMNLVPQLRALVNFFSLILKDYVKSSEILNQLNTLNLNEFNQFSKKLYSRMNHISFIHGDLNTKDAINLYKNSMINQFNKIKNTNIRNYINYHADLSGYFMYREKMPNSYNLNHAVLNFYQIGKEDIQNLYMANLVKILCGYIYFTQLRIKEQLGYTAKGKVFSEGNTIYYLILVQGSKMTPEKMDLRIENVVKLMRERLLSTSELKFRKYKRILTRRIGKRDRSLMRRTKRLWNEIITNRRYFNIFQIVRKFSLNIEKKDLIKFFDKLFSKDLAKLSIQEFSSLVKLVPRTSLKVNGLKGLLIKTKNFFRKRNKYLKL